MTTFSDLLTSWLTSLPGLALYQLLLLLCVIMAAQLAWLRRARSAADNEYQAITFLLLIRVLVLLSAPVIILFRLDAGQILPVLDRLDLLLSFIWMSVFLLQLKRTKITNILLAVAHVLIFAFAIYSVVTWKSAYPNSTINATGYETVWSITTILALLIALTTHLIFADRGNLVTLLLMGFQIVGVLLQLIRPDFEANFAAPMRLALLVTLPFLPFIVANRLVKAGDKPAADAGLKAEPPAPLRAAEKPDTDETVSGYSEASRGLLQALTQQSHALLVGVENQTELKTISALEHQSLQLAELVAKNESLLQMLDASREVRAGAGATRASFDWQEKKHLLDLVAYGESASAQEQDASLIIQPAIVNIIRGASETGQAVVTLDRIMDSAISHSRPEIQSRNLTIKILGDTSGALSQLNPAYLEAVLTLLIQNVIETCTADSTVTMQLAHSTRRLILGLTYHGTDEINQDDLRLLSAHSGGTLSKTDLSNGSTTLTLSFEFNPS